MDFESYPVVSKLGASPQTTKPLGFRVMEGENNLNFLPNEQFLRFLGSFNEKDVVLDFSATFQCGGYVRKQPLRLSFSEYYREPKPIPYTKGKRR